MALLNLCYYPNPILKESSKDVRKIDASILKLLNDMAETMYAHNGVGLAAPQVGILKRVIVIDTDRRSKNLETGTPKFYINPEIIYTEEKTTSEEGCLSIVGKDESLFRDSVPRFRKVRVKALNEKGEKIEVEAEDLEAFCFQHEIDHLNGVLFTDRLSRLKKSMFLKWIKKHGAPSSCSAVGITTKEH